MRKLSQTVKNVYVLLVPDMTVKASLLAPVDNRSFSENMLTKRVIEVLW